jgi:DNA-binding MarR family transcriptional regulator
VEEGRDSIEELLRVFRRFRKLNQKARPFGKCHPGAFYMLTGVRGMCEANPDMPGVSIGELAGFMEVSMPAVSKMVRNLEEKKLVKRITDPGNRRVVYVRLTEDGEKILLEAEKQEMIKIRNVARCLGEEDTNHLIRIMKKLCELEKSSREESKC